jgi:LPXTG-motif cell wall-anchored protein
MTTPSNASGLKLVNHKFSRVGKVVEGKLDEFSKVIESKTGTSPSKLLFWAAAGVVLTSALLKFTKRRHLGVCAGEWVATSLLPGVYRKFANAPARAKRI